MKADGSEHAKQIYYYNEFLMGKYVVKTPFLKVSRRAYYPDYTVLHCPTRFQIATIKPKRWKPSFLCSTSLRPPRGAHRVHLHQGYKPCFNSRNLGGPPAYNHIGL